MEIPDELVWRKVEKSADAVVRIEAKLDNLTERSQKLESCSNRHERRIKKLESQKRSNIAWDWSKKGGIGAIVLGVIYFILERLKWGF